MWMIVSIIARQIFAMPSETEKYSLIRFIHVIVKILKFWYFKMLNTKRIEMEENGKTRLVNLNKE